MNKYLTSKYYDTKPKKKNIIVRVISLVLYKGYMQGLNFVIHDYEYDSYIYERDIIYTYIK